MNNELLCVATFAIGAGVGSVVTWAILKKKYQKQVQEEVASIKEAYQQVIDNIQNSELTVAVTEEATPEEEETDEDLGEYMEIVKDNGYSESTPKPLYGKHSTPHIIAPEELGDTDFEIVSLTYYDDGILADDWGNVIDIDSTIGDDSLNHFGDYEDDAIHVRNHQLETDYEVLLEERTYSEVFNK